MPANPERMRPTPASQTEIMQRTNQIVKAEAEKVATESDKGLARNAIVFLAGTQKYESK